MAQRQPQRGDRAPHTVRDARIGRQYLTLAAFRPCLCETHNNHKQPMSVPLRPAAPRYGFARVATAATIP